MANMTEREMECFKHFLSQYKHQWDLNSYYRDGFDDDMEYYLSYRNQTEYPLAFNVFFNKLLPRIFTVLSRFMEQLYQAGAHNLVSVRPRKSADAQRAKRVEGLLNFQMETLNELDMTGGSYLFNLQWMFNAISFGKGIAKVVWKKEERITPERMSVPMPKFSPNGQLMGMEQMDIVREIPQIVYDGPYAEVIHNKMFTPHPHYKSIQKMPAVFCVYKRPIDYIKKMADRGVYKNVSQLGWEERGNVTARTLDGQDSGEAFAKSIDIEGVSYETQEKTDYITPEVDILESYGRYIFPEDEVPYEVGSGMLIKGKESEAIAHIGNYKTLLKIEKNKYGYRPFFDISAYHHPELYWDIGIINLGKGIQEQVNNMGNTRLQNAMQLVNQMLKVREGSDIPQEALIPKPFGIIPVEEMDDVQPLLIPDVSAGGVFREQEQFFDDTLSDMTGMYAYNLGQTPQRQEHVGTIYSLQSMGEARTKLLMMTMDHQGFQPLIRYMMTLNAWHLPSEFEFRIGDPNDGQFAQLFAQDIHPEYDFTARYTSMEPALGRNARAQQLIQLAGTWAQSPYLQQYEWMKAIMELTDIDRFNDVNKMLKTPEQLMQEQQKAMQAEMMSMKMQDQMAAQQSSRELKRDVVKGLMKG